MTLSMTAFARKDLTTESGDLSWEIRSVNHRYLEVGRRLPETFRALESSVREQVAKHLNRGKVECNLSFQANDAADEDLALDEALLKKVVDLAHQVEILAHNVTNLRTVDLLRWPGVVRSGRLDLESLHQRAMELLDQALQDLVQTRKREGECMAQIIAKRLDGMGNVIDQLKPVLPEIVSAYRQRLQERLADIQDRLDPARVEQEVVIFAQKADVAEEIDRLETHVAEVRRVLKKKGPVGRRLDFLMQELNREANTLGSKAGDMRLTNASVELKVLIEQIREQVQNIE
ncbi:MAG TPA: YicC family protein [Acidiferrobacteraceae bacterium]|nr:YicC family protein [Acidiferrobacteraceae bacterium]